MIAGKDFEILSLKAKLTNCQRTNSGINSLC